MGSKVKICTEKKKCCTGENLAHKLKILAIHGYKQNAEAFRKRTEAFRKLSHKWAHFIYITAPHKVDNANSLNESSSSGEESVPNIGQSNKDEEQYGWFSNKDDNIRTDGPAIGFEESIKLVETVFDQQGPFDGILGFSQGACFVGLLCDLQHRGLLNFNFKFAIISCGCKFWSMPHLKYYSERINLPSLHIFGENDKIISTEMCEALSKCFEEPVIIRHPYGHCLPCSTPRLHDYQKFLKQQLWRKLHGELPYIAAESK